ncbi:hypothetical protein EDD17DRAFT_1892187 [Pisolithus thermaeus]|nr:hypothetical protein EV401DRAFT_1895076 [Pisolithus croceorrhizus]KAI6168850.1 hypothetical protein EDD17DRAFT_1892187 [Pisolithus thermaeus]
MREEETSTPWVAEYREIIDQVVLTAILTTLSKLHFCQVEGLRDLIEAETKAQRKIAVYRVKDVQKAKSESLRAKIRDCLMYVEGFIDFGEVVDELGQGDVLENELRMGISLFKIDTRLWYGGGASTLKTWIVLMYKTGQLSYTDATRLLSTASSSHDSSAISPLYWSICCAILR